MNEISGFGGFSGSHKKSKNFWFITFSGYPFLDKISFKIGRSAKNRSSVDDEFSE